MITFVEILIFISAMFFVGYPFFKRSPIGQGFSPADRGEAEASHYNELVHKKETAYITIKDLEFDYRTGKLSQADYMELKNRYEAEALQTLKEIDDFKVQEKGAVFCPKCGTKTKAEDNFCFKCGAKLPQG